LLGHRARAVPQSIGDIGEGAAKFHFAQKSQSFYVVHGVPNTLEIIINTHQKE
jgi:hypothetical protein